MSTRKIRLVKGCEVLIKSAHSVDVFQAILPAGTILEFEEVKEEENDEVKELQRKSHPNPDCRFPVADQANCICDKKRYKPEEGRWATKNKIYFYISSPTLKSQVDNWVGNIFDKERLEAGNCFPNMELAEKARLAVLETLKTFHQNNQ